MIEKKWSPDILNELIKASGKTYDQIAADTGIGRSTLNKVANNRYPASADILITLANYFGVTTDLLCGQVSDKALADILIVYPEYFTGLLRCSYEKSLESIPRKIPAGYLAVWPYNLLDDIFMEAVDLDMNEDRMAGLEKALNTLYPQEKAWLLLVYKEGNSIKATGETVGKSTERVRQVVHKAIRKLRHPARRRLIIDGIKGCQEIAEEREMISDQKRKLIQERMELEKLKEECEAISNQKQLLAQEKIEMLKKLNNIDPLDAPLDLAEMDLSVRSFNCLWRARFKTIRELLKHAESGELYRVRNLGVKSITEVLQKLYDRGYITYDQAAEYAEANKVNQFKAAPWTPMIHGRKDGVA